MNNKLFFASVKINLFAGTLSQSQVDGINAILKECNNQQLFDYRKIAYVLATSYHETGFEMKPVKEAGRGAGYDYGKKLKRGGGKSKRIPYTEPDQLYYGRGDVQLTWYENYEAFGKLFNIPLLEHPDLALTNDVSKKILVYGMIHGYFTGKKLNDYITETVTDYINARRIINGTDAAARIASYADRFHNAMILK